jgi:hypothetical protein
MQKSNKQKKKKSDSKNNSNHSSSNNSNTSDENKNSLNNSGNISKEKNIITTSQQEQQELSIKSNQPEHKTEKLNQLKNLKYIFPFFTEIKQEDNKTKNYSISEYNKIVSSINKNNKISDKNNYEEDILKGKINIIDKIIQKYMPTSNDNKVIQIHQGLTSLSLKIDKNFNMLNDIGYRLPNLISLDLSGSEIESIMDIGTSFNKLEKLNVSNCGLSDLNGIICFNNLKELIASNNKITDLIYIEMCEELKIIDLSYNLIEDENNLLFLNSCPNLQKVILTGNKIKNCGKNLLDKNIQLVI